MLCAGWAAYAARAGCTPCATCIRANCGMSCARGACRMHSTRDVRRPGGFGGQLVAGRAPGYPPGIRRVYARYTPEQVSELDRGRPASARARRSNANRKLTAAAGPQSRPKHSEEPPTTIEELRPLKKRVLLGHQAAYITHPPPLRKYYHEASITCKRYPPGVFAVYIYI